MKVQKWQQEKKFIEKNKNAERPGGNTEGDFGHVKS